jgi:hypothetical protein
VGKASRTKAQRRRARGHEAEFGVFCPGVLEVLSIGKGDLKLTLDGKNPEDVERARSLIEEMLRKGYSIFVETDDGPVRVTKFNPKRMTYIVMDAPAAPDLAEATPPKKAKRPRERHVPVAGSRATAVGRTSGG